MKKRYLFPIVIVAPIIFLLFMYQNDHRADNDKLTVVCTTTMITDAVAYIGGDSVNVIGLMGPGVDPHLYRASARTVDQLSSADIIMYHGLHLEGKIADTLHALGTTKHTVAVTDALDRQQLIATEFAGMYDPHVWHDAALWIKVVRYIGDQLALYDPKYAQTYKNRADDYAYQIERVDNYIKQQCLQLSDDQRILVTAHDAFAYFGRAYGIEVVALQGMNTDAQISPKDVSELARFVIEKSVSTIFFESSIPHRTMEAVSQAVALHGRTVKFGEELLSDALGDVQTEQGNYCGMMLYNCDAIVRGLTHA